MPARPGLTGPPPCPRALRSCAARRPRPAAAEAGMRAGSSLRITCIQCYMPPAALRPGNLTTRPQLCKIIVRAEGWTIDTTGGPHLDDVPETNPFYGFIETAYQHNLISGYADRTFRPGNNIPRAQLCTIIVLAMG